MGESVKQGGPFRCVGANPSEAPVAPALQIGYTTVFFWEYFGPLVTYSVFYFFPHVFYPSYKCAPPAGVLWVILSNIESGSNL